MPESFDYELNAYLRNEDAKIDRCDEIADELTAMFIDLGITDKAELYKNGSYQGDFNLQAAIQHACMHDEDDIWDVKELEK
jgi:hypothetical protein